MEPIRSIAEIPFFEKDPFDLLHFQEGREVVDYDYYLYGYSRIDDICLFERNSPEPLPVVRDALVLALHAADDGEVFDDDVELEFFVDEVADDYSVTVLLSDFLANWLPQISQGERAIVLALCNPHNATVARPAIASRVPLYYPLGDAESSYDRTDGRLYINLLADAWRTAT